MDGIKHLATLLACMKPHLDDKEYIFCTFPSATIPEMLHLNPLCCFYEEEGLTLIIQKDCAIEHKIRFSTVLKMISLTIHSSLDAVGLTAAISGKLAEKGISANVVAAYYHDHIFVQKEYARQAMNSLIELQMESLPYSSIQ